MKEKKTLGVLVFPDFESLDVYGPVEMFGNCASIEIRMLAESREPVASSQGPKTGIDHRLDACPDLDWLLVPGGIGTRREVNNAALISWIRDRVPKLELVLSVCTGAALLAQAGVLNGHSATTNKRAFSWVASLGPQVNWVHQARWVEDGRFFSSSGVSAGMDMAVAVIKRFWGDAESTRISRWAEYEPREDPSYDPFAALYPLEK